VTFCAREAVFADLGHKEGTFCARNTSVGTLEAVFVPARAFPCAPGTIRAFFVPKSPMLGTLKVILEDLFTKKNTFANNDNITSTIF
jgi:hypothetical protein